MFEKDHIESLLKEAEVYQTQGLLEESKEKYLEVLEIIKNNEELSEDKHLIDSVNNKLRSAEDALDEVDKEPEIAELSEEVQNLITELFSFSKDNDVAAIEGAVALATFGQYEKALAEFQRLLNEGVLPMTVAKNMLRCHLSFAMHEPAISQFEQWVSRNTFSVEDLNCLRLFLENSLEREGIKADLPQVDITASDNGIKEETSKDVFEILSVRVIFDDGPMKGQIKNFDVMFQLGNSVTFEIKANEEESFRFFEPGTNLDRLQCFSHFFYFNTTGIISEKKMATNGPKRGVYSIVLKLKSP
jgi:tetratricopeptide (TPR) repeat protein